MELIKKIEIKDGGVYITSRSIESGTPYRERHIESLSKVYRCKGIGALDFEIIRLAMEFAELTGSDDSVMRYITAIDAAKKKHLNEEMATVLRKKYAQISRRDVRSRNEGRPTPHMKEYLVLLDKELRKYYQSIAGLVRKSGDLNLTGKIDRK